MPTLAPSLHTVWATGLPLCVHCRSCGHRAAIPHKAIKAYAGNMKALSGLRLKCSKCGGKDIESTLVYTEGELQGFLRGECLAGQ
jgi:hypothetical protein